MDKEVGWDQECFSRAGLFRKIKGGFKRPLCFFKRAGQSFQSFLS